MKCFRILLLLTTLFSTTLSFGQKGKIDDALNSFINTEFMLKFKDMKIEAESAVRHFKQQSSQYDVAAVQRVQTGYDQTAYRFNQLLNTIKTDFMNNKKMKYISKFPDTYIKGLELELYQLSDYYALHFQQPLADATAEQIDGAAMLLIVTELIGLTKGLFDYFGQIKRESKKYNESYLNHHLVQPFRFRYWDEIGPEGMVAPATGMDPYAAPIDQYPQNATQFPDLGNLPGLISNGQNGSDFSDPYNNAGTYDEYLNQQGGNGQNEWNDPSQYTDPGYIDPTNTNTGNDPYNTDNGNNSNINKPKPTPATKTPVAPKQDDN